MTSELHLMRTILERLECSFARQEAKIDRQEAKLDRLLEEMTKAPATVPQTPQCLPPVPALMQPPSYGTPSFEYPLRPQEMEVFDTTPSPMMQSQRLSENINVTGNC